MIFPLHRIRARVWGERIEALAAVLGHCQLPAKRICRRARKVLGWSERRTRCVLSAGEDSRFRWDRRTNTWRVLPGPRGVRWSAEMHRWVVPGTEEAAAHDTRVELQELASYADRVSAVLQAAKRQAEMVELDGDALPAHRPPPPRPRPKGAVQVSILEVA